MADISFSSTLFNCAIECALKRQTKACKNKFGAPICYECKWYVQRYIEADPRRVQLFMIEAETKAAILRIESNGLLSGFILAIIICLLLALWSYNYEKGLVDKFKPNHNVVQQTQQVQSVNSLDPEKELPGIDNKIWEALRKTADDLNKGMDTNNDSLVNCIDAAVRFYYHFPNKDYVCIVVNYDSQTGMHHLFNGVWINGSWRMIEPQAALANHKSYYMRDIWGSGYNPARNVVATKQYIKYVK